MKFKIFKQRILKVTKSDYFFYAGSELIAKLLLTAYMLALAKVLTPESYGKLGYLLSIAYIMQLFFAGSGQVAVGRIIKEDFYTPSSLNKILTVIGIYGIIAYSILSLLASLPLVKSLTIFSLLELLVVTSFALLLAYYTVIERYFINSKKYKKLALFIAVLSISMVINTYLLITLNIISDHKLRFLSVLPVYLALIIYFIYTIEFKFSFGFREFKYFFNVTKWMLPHSLLAAFVVYGDRILLANFFTPYEFGQIFLAAQLAALTGFFNKIVNAYWQPFYFHLKGIGFYKTGRLINFLTFIFFVLVLFAGEFVVDYFYAEKFPEAKSLMYLFLLGYYYQSFYHMENASASWRKNFKIITITSVTAVVVLFSLAPILYSHFSFIYSPILFSLVALIQWAVITIENKVNEFKKMRMIQLIFFSLYTLLIFMKVS